LISAAGKSTTIAWTAQWTAFCDSMLPQTRAVGEWLGAAGTRLGLRRHPLAPLSVQRSSISVVKGVWRGLLRRGFSSAERAGVEKMETAENIWGAVVFPFSWSSKHWD
jgi:hypothetical protein